MEKRQPQKKNLPSDGPACIHSRVLYLPANQTITIQQLINFCGCCGGRGKESGCGQRNTYQPTAQKSTVLWLKPGKPHKLISWSISSHTGAAESGTDYYSCLNRKNMILYLNLYPWQNINLLV